MNSKTLNWNCGNENINKQNKNSAESLGNRLDQVEDKILGLEDKV
jgi:hypothetical protein